MDISDWIRTQGLSVADAARRLGIGGVNPARTLDRLAKGERGADSDMIERIAALTDGLVTAQDMHETRLNWLRAHRPDKFGMASPAEVQP